MIVISVLIDMGNLATFNREIVMKVAAQATPPSRLDEYACIVAATLAFHSSGNLSSE